ncbi:PHP domain-containing protein [Herbidospora sp. NEAU-GS84]|uniref:PHP domain-containing protein n=1 Tax=Herbidospora solisilvae TaxID=2696284 RepID=A0A7C9NK23_9ACTN|nr:MULTISPECIES: PHP domain-containing protein [Herbidospora]NAS20436.1 PHP domain-containing protein [Herbidospora solisilvae]GLX93538.1 phosphatase [Herbidospora sp. NBRC 101105]
MRIDLHSHSTASDGTSRPAEVVWRAREAGLDVLALTDHDGVGGHAEALANLPDGLTLVPGMELSCRRDGMSIHMLAYLFDPDHPGLARETALIREARDGRAAEMVARLIDLGVPITMEMVERIAGGGVVGRPHVARAMLAVGAVADIEEAFSNRWIGSGGRAHVARYALDPVRAVELTRAAGGVAVLAHPRSAKRGRVVPDEWIADMAAAGLTGIEVDHRDHTTTAREELRGLAKDLGLVVTGSSDDHGELTGHRLGCETTAPEAYEALLDAVPSRT